MQISTLPFLRMIVTSESCSTGKNRGQESKSLDREIREPPSAACGRNQSLSSRKDAKSAKERGQRQSYPGELGVLAR